MGASVQKRAAAEARRASREASLKVARRQRTTQERARKQQRAKALKALRLSKKREAAATKIANGAVKKAPVRENVSAAMSEQRAKLRKSLLSFVKKQVAKKSR